MCILHSTLVHMAQERDRFQQREGFCAHVIRGEPRKAHRGWAWCGCGFFLVAGRYTIALPSEEKPEHCAASVSSGQCAIGLVANAPKPMSQGQSEEAAVTHTSTISLHHSERKR